MKCHTRRVEKQIGEGKEDTREGRVDFHGRKMQQRRTETAMVRCLKDTQLLENGGGGVRERKFGHGASTCRTEGQKPWGVTRRHVPRQVSQPNEDLTTKRLAGKDVPEGETHVPITSVPVWGKRATKLIKR